MNNQKQFERKIGIAAVAVLSPLLVWVAVSKVIPRLIEAVTAAFE